MTRVSSKTTLADIMQMSDKRIANIPVWWWGTTTHELKEAVAKRNRELNKSWFYKQCPDFYEVGREEFWNTLCVKDDLSPVPAMCDFPHEFFKTMPFTCYMNTILCHDFATGNIPAACVVEYRLDPEEDDHRFSRRGQFEASMQTAMPKFIKMCNKYIEAGTAYTDKQTDEDD